MMSPFYNQQQQQPLERFQENLNIVQAFLHVSSIPLLVIFRYRLGRRLFANLTKNFGIFTFFTSGFGLLVLLFLAHGLLSQGNPFWLVAFLTGTLFLMLWHRAAMLFRRKEVYSVSLGHSWLWKILPYGFVQTILEPLIAAFIGFLISKFNAPLGMFLIWSAVSLFFVQFQARQNETEERILFIDGTTKGQDFENYVNTTPEESLPASRVRVHQPKNNQSKQYR